MMIISDVSSYSTTSFVTSSTTDSGNGNNAISVTATQLDFITQWLANANQNYDAPLDADPGAPFLSPTAKARDANGNLDLGFNAAVTLNAGTLNYAFDSNGLDSKTYPLSNTIVTVSNGLITFNAGLSVTSAGNGTAGDISRLVITSAGLTSGNSNNFTLVYSNESDVIKDPAFASGNAHPNGYDENINYEAYPDIGFFRLAVWQPPGTKSPGRAVYRIESTRF